MNTNTGDKPADPYKQANAEEVSLDTKVNDLVEFMKNSKFGMMTTKAADSDKLASRCMALAATEAGGVDLLFHTNTESGKVHDLAEDSHINMSFINASGEWASIAGTATVEADREIVKKYYSPALKAWLGDLGDGKHDGSENDPRIGIIRIKTETASYSLTAKNIFSRVGEVVQGALTGQPAHVNKLREITETETKLWRTSH